MSVVAAAVIGAAVVGAGVSVYAATRSGSDVQTSMPASYYSYDSDGNLTGSQVWDASKNAYVYTENLTDEQKAENAKIAELKAQILANLNKTPEDRVAAYEEYAQTFSDAMHSEVDEQFEKLKTSSEESLAAKGMLGSKAYVDTMADLDKQKTDMDTEIAQKAILAKEELANTDRTYWLNVLSTLENAENTDAALALQKSQTAAQAATQGTAALTAADQIANSTTLANWESKQNSLNTLSSNLTNTSAGLAFLYGYKSGGLSTKKSNYLS